MSTDSGSPGFRVLLIESDPLESERLATLLEAADHDVFPLGSVSEAREALDLQRFDVVLVTAAAAPDLGLAQLAAHVRQIEEKFSPPVHIPIVARGDMKASPAESENIDAELPCPFEAQAFRDMVLQLSNRVRLADPKQQSMSDAPEMTVFDSDAFAEQVCSDPELMVEIIDLYLEESEIQIQALITSEAEGRMDDLSQAAHKIKGSLGSLHAPRARASAQTLETAAKAGLTGESGDALLTLLRNLEELNPVLRQFRQAQTSALG